MTSLIICNLRP